LTFLSHALLYTFELDAHVWVGDCYKEPEIREPQIKLNKQWWHLFQFIKPSQYVL